MSSAPSVMYLDPSCAPLPPSDHADCPLSPRCPRPILRSDGHHRFQPSEGKGNGRPSESTRHNTRQRHKSVNFFLETPYQTLSNVRSHCLIESQCSTDKIHAEMAMQEIRDVTLPTAVYNILFSMSGPVVLLLPGLFQRTAWWGLAPLAVVGVGMQHASQCVTKFVLDDPLLLTYRHVGTKVLGTFGSYLVLALQVINYAAAALILLRLGVDNLALLLLHGFPSKPPLPYAQLVFFGTFLTLPFLFLRALDNIGAMSLIGYLTYLIGVLCMAVTVLLALRDGTLQPGTRYHSGHLEGILSASSVACFGFGGHMYLVFPGLLGVMRRPQEYIAALRIAFAVKLAAFCLFPAFCFYAFGGDVQPNVLSNMPPGRLTLVALLLMTLQCIFLVAVVLSPLFYVTELFLGIEQEGEHRQKLPEVVSRCITRTILAGSLALLTLYLWRKGITLLQLIQFFGGSTVLLSAWLLPICLHLKHYGTIIPGWQQLSSLAVLALGCTIFGFNVHHTVVPVLSQLARSSIHTPLPIANRPATPNGAAQPRTLKHVLSALPPG